MMRTEQEQWWAGDFGSSYVDRNKIDWRSRLDFWNDIVTAIKPKSVLEVGCNRGHNLKCLRDIDSTIALWGCDVNQKAIDEASDAGLAVSNTSVFDLANEFIGGFNLVFTAGVLIHVSDEDLDRAVGCIVAASNRYVLGIEYDHATGEEIDYRGHAQRLWKRPFAEVYRRHGLNIISSGFLPSLTSGFDDCTFWLCEKA